ncbi:palmitoyltransferase ZDHHC23-B [Achroia grisella]|uniref:palmitoyltransferase ZDHHC23-B n=1 Tax=Achroia grisella TaxID=688607 RepID=UPI0027D26577|nr:palmitoyltransferase ZDHHC23-B [Achroia grisella]
MVNKLLSVEDILRYSRKKPSRKIDMDAILPFLILPILLLIATISRATTIIVMVAIAMGTSYVLSRPRQKNRSPFFYSWTLSSGLYLFLVFEIGVLGLLEVTQLENFIFLMLFISTGYFFYKMKTVGDFELTAGSSKGKEYSPVLTADSCYCRICQIEVNDMFFHSIWWDCCVLKLNYGYFLAGQFLAFATLLFGTNLGLTSVCQPFILYGSILLPENCDDVYYEFNLALCFVSCVYGVGYLIVILIVLLKQLIIYIPIYSEPQWRKLVNVFNV